ncbi:MAG: DUF2336 domain-containing protein [Rhodospirillales bacterium]|nr:DUF2336 domain-containing protein [Rhodospirillales bacterium]
MSKAIQSKIEALLQVAQTSRGTARAEIGNQLGEILADAPAALDRGEFEIAADIVRQLIRETEAEIRRRLAERLAETPDAPRELVLALANDEISIARPLLTMSAALADSDLVEIIRQRGQAHRLAIANRTDVSAAVSAALVEAGDADVMEELLANRSARIAEATFAYLSDLSRERENLQRPLVSRDDLPGDVAARLYGWVAADLKRQIRDRYAFDANSANWSQSWEGAVDWAVDDAAQGAAADHGASMDWGSSADRLADTIRAERLNDPAILVRTLRQGHVSLFEALFARFAELPMKVGRRILYQADGRALAVAAKALGMERTHYLALAHLIKRTSASEGRLMPADAAADQGPPLEAVAMFDRVGLPEAVDVLARWRTKPPGPPAGRDPVWARRVEPVRPAG